MTETTQKPGFLRGVANKIGGVTAIVIAVVGLTEAVARLTDKDSALHKIFGIGHEAGSETPAPAPQPNPPSIPFANAGAPPAVVPAAPVAQPPAVTTSPSVEFQPVMITHNLSVSAPMGVSPGMQIGVRGRVASAAGRNLQVVVRFFGPNGPLVANPSEAVYRDADGLVAAGAQRFSVVADDQPLPPAPIELPYYALNFAPTGGVAAYQLKAVAFVYLDERPLAQSAPAPFMLRW